MRIESPMVVDCETCPVQGVRCDDCVVTALAGLPVFVQREPYRESERVSLRDDELSLDAGERRAVSRFVAAGLVAPEVAATLTARRESWSPVRRVG